MAFIETISEQDATGPVAEIYATERARRGYVPNYAAVFAEQPDVYTAWAALNGAIKSAMGARRYELVTVAAARRLRSTYCALAHGALLADGLLEPETARALLVDGATDGLDAADAAAMRLAGQVVDDATAVTQADIDELRGLGLSDADIVAVVAAAAARCFFSKTLDALGAQADPAYRALGPELVEALVVGRPVADG
jgi:uncharacterized peroxidase-related enzyme